MKIALISNMNNNYFGLLRYFIDLDVDVKLFCFLDEYANFTPEYDTWFFDKYKQYIDKLPFKYYDHYNVIKSFDRDLVKNKLDNFDILIGSGPTPAYLLQLGISLDYFMPYKTGIEYFKDDLSFRKFKQNYLLRSFNKIQRKALSNTKYALNEDFRDLTYKRIQSLNMKNIAVNAPMLYLEKKPAKIKLDKVYEVAIRKMRKSDFVVFHAGRHQWKRSKKDKILKAIKGIPFLNNNANDSIIKAFVNFNKKTKNKNNLLVLFEYGTQVELSKSLIRDLKISQNVIWLPTSPRKVILEVTKHASVAIGDIAVGGWGGKALEALSLGVPVIQSVSEENRNLFKKHKKIDLPPFILIDHNLNLVNQLQTLFDKYSLNLMKLKEIGEMSKNWFFKNEGFEKAKKLLDIIKKNYIKDQNNA